MKCLNFWDIVIKPQYRSKPKVRDLPLSAIDTETREGRAFLICDSWGNVCYPESFLDCLKFLTARRFEQRINLFYNIRYDVLAILKWVNDVRLYRALHFHKKFAYKGFEFKYYDKKFLKVKKGNRVFTFYDLAQFFECSLDEASQKYLGEHKIDLDVENFGKYSPEEIERYCIRDAQLTLRLGTLLKEKMIGSGVYSHKWISKANISEKYFRRTCYIPTLRGVPEEVLEYAYNSYRGGWIETFKKGYFPKAYEYDIKSAYPSHIRNLISFKYGKWVKRKGLAPSSAIKGFVKCKVEVWKEKTSPISVRYRHNISLNPVGEWVSYLTLAEAEYINSCMGLDSWCKLIDGWYFIPDRLVYPFRREIDRLYRLKETAKTYMERLLYKIILNSLYGKFIELNRRKGKWESSMLFNPMWASEITANTRLQLASLIDPDTLLVAQDSFITTRKRDFNNNNGIGSVELKAQGEAIILGCGVYEIAGKVRNRGFKSKLNLRELLNQDEVCIKYKEKRPVSLAQALFNRAKFKIDDLNCFIEDEKIRDINFDIKRFWLPWNSAREVLKTQRDSEPVLLSFLQLFT